MPKGIPKKGFRISSKHKGRGIERLETRLQDDVPRLIEALEQLTRPLPCPQCGHIIKLMDREAACFLIDHAIGKPRQKLEMDITKKIELSPEQIERLMKRYQIAQRLMLPGGEESVNVDDNNEAVANVDDKAMVNVESDGYDGQGVTETRGKDV